MRLLVTGGGGFIGSNFIKYVLKHKENLIDKIVNVDCLTYAANEENIKEFCGHPKYLFKLVDITSFAQISDAFKRGHYSHVIHFAAETHVDNAIKNPRKFLETNIIGTYNLLESAKNCKVEKFHHISTDEVYGHLGEKGKFKETTPYDPRNPYSASKASADMLVKSYFHTYGLPINISNCSNNYGPKQHREKLVPTIITSLLKNKKIPVYNDGLNIRDWIYVEDHCQALWKVLSKGKIGETYNIGSNCEKTNIDVIKAICTHMGKDHKSSIKFIKDRLGHDFRYAINASKIRSKLLWKPKRTFTEGIKETVDFYAHNSKSECKI